MNIQDQVCSWQQGLQLKKLGIKQDGYFTWMECLLSNDGDNFQKHWAVFRPNIGAYDFMTDMPFPDWWKGDSEGSYDEFETGKECSAFTVAELGVMLPSEQYTEYTGSTPHRNAPWEWTNYGLDRGMGVFDTEAQARADQLIFLLKKGKIKVEDVNERLLTTKQ